MTDNTIPIKSLEVTRPQVILAAARKFDFGKVGLTAELDMTMFMDGKRNTLISSYPFSFDPTIGFEADYKKFVFLRAGINNIQEKDETLNFSIMLKSEIEGLSRYKVKLTREQDETIKRDHRGNLDNKALVFIIHRIFNCISI